MTQNTATTSPNNQAPLNSQNSADKEVAIQELTNSQLSFYEYIYGRKRSQLFLITGLSVSWEILFFYANTKIFIPWFLPIIPVIIIIFWLLHLRKLYLDSILQEFAAKNNFSFQKFGIVDETFGSIFRIGDDQNVSDIVTGAYSDCTFRLFLFDFSIQEGKSRHNYSNTVVELDLQGLLPNLLLVSKSYKSYDNLQLLNAFGVKEKLSLEGDFNDRFTLYSQKGGEVEALEVFNPEVMALVEDKAKDFCIEFAANRVYIYLPRYVKNSHQIEQMFDLIKLLKVNIATLARHMKNDDKLIADAINISQFRKPSLMVNKNILTIIITIFFIVHSIIIISLTFSLNSK